MLMDDPEDGRIRIEPKASFLCFAGGSPESMNLGQIPA